MKHLLLLVAMLFCSVSSVFADDNDDLITQQITVNVSKAGTLKDKISSSKKYRITSLKVTGELNVDDIQFIREMSGCYESAASSNDGGETWKHSFRNGNLQYLDIKDVQFVSNNKEWPYNYINVYKETSDLSGEEATVYVDNTDQSVYINGLFYYLPNIKSIMLPDNIYSLGDYVFEGCRSLEKLDIPSSVRRINYSTFKGCSSLGSITIPNEETRISSSTFYSCI